MAQSPSFKDVIHRLGAGENEAAAQVFQRFANRPGGECLVLFCGFAFHALFGLEDKATLAV